MTEEEEFEFRLRFEQEQSQSQFASQVESVEPQSGTLKGLRDPIDALAQMLYNVVPEEVQKSGDAINAWLAEKTGGLLGDPTGGNFNEQLKRQEAKYQAGRKTEGDEGVDLDRIGGSILSTIALPGTAITKVPTLLGKIGVGAATGAGYGTLTPVTDKPLEEFWPEKLKQAGTGAVFGGTLPLAGAGFSKAGEKLKGAGKYLDETLNPNAGIKKFIRNEAGVEKKQLIKAMQEAKPMIGAKPTVAQAISQSQQPGSRFGGQFAKLEKDMSREPIIGVPLANKYDLQEAGRQKVIDAIAGTSDDMIKAKGARKAASDPWYKAVETSEQRVNTAPVIDKINDLVSKNKNQSSVTAPLNDIKTKIESGVTAREMSSMSKGIRDMMNESTKGNQDFNVKALESVKSILDKQIGKSEIAHKVAQSSFKQMSKPINQMEVGAKLKEALINPKQDESAASFLRAIRNAPQTIKKATGFKRYEKLEQVLSPEQIKGVQSIADDLIIQSKVGKLAKETKGIAEEIPGKKVDLQLPHILSRPIVIANHFLKMIGKDQTSKYKKMIVDLLEDPEEFKKILDLPKSDERHGIAKDLLRELSVMGMTKATLGEQ